MNETFKREGERGLYTVGGVGENGLVRSGSDLHTSIVCE